MTPLHLEILMNHYTGNTNFGMDRTTTATTEYTYDLAKIGLLYTPKDCARLELTDYGLRIVNKFMAEFSKLAQKES